MIRTNLLKAAMIPVGVMALLSTANAAVVDCSTLTISCYTFQKGGVKFKPVLSAANTLGNCNDANNVAVKEALSIKGKLLSCAVSNPNVKVVSGSVKGTLYTDDCSCNSLSQASVPIATPPLGKTNALVASWKFDSTSTDTCMPGQNLSTIVQVPGTSVVHQGFFHAPSPPFSAALGATYGGFWLSGAGTSVSGGFQGGDGGATTLVAGLSNEDVFFLATTCQSIKGLKALTFGQAAAELK